MLDTSSMPTREYKTSDGVVVPGTTTIIGASLGWNKGPLMYWAWKKGKEGKNFRDDSNSAAEAGTLAHAMAEADIKGLPMPAGWDAETDVAKQARTAFQGYLDWKSMTGLKLLDSEMPYVSDAHRFGGTLDGLAEINGKHALIDFKTSNGTYPDHIIQLAAYKHLWETANEALLDGGIHLLRFGKDGGDFHHSHYVRERMAKPWAAFLNLRALYDLKSVIEKMV